MIIGYLAGVALFSDCQPDICSPQPAIRQSGKFDIILLANQLSERAHP